MKRSLILSITLLFLLSGLLSIQRASGAADTVFVLSLEVNMAKAIRSGIFDPSLDRLYVVFDSGIEDQQLVASDSSKFTLMLTQGFDSGAVCHFRFRINDFITESVDRQILIGQGINYYSCWWNNAYLNYTWFQVDMSYPVQQHTFRPDTDYVDMIGNINNWQGSPHFTQIGTSYVYQTMYNIEPDFIAAFKFRINGDSNGVELKGKPNRLLLAPDSLIHSLYWFNNYNPSKIPMTFSCDMKYMTWAKHFSRHADHVDVAGSFNGNGAYDILYDDNKDSIYTATVLIDTAYYRQNPISFKYRINSSWLTAELKGQPFRTYVLHDTISGPNTDDSWFNNWNPLNPTIPMANDVDIQGVCVFKEVLSGVYTYENINGFAEGVSTYQWYRSSDSLGINLTRIDTAIHITYTIDTLSIHQWLVFEVTPVADSGDLRVGNPVRVITRSSVGAVGISDLQNLISRVYPNPSYEKVKIEGLTEINKIELYDLTGRSVFVLDKINDKQCIINPSGLLPGIYLLKATGKDNTTGHARVLRQ